MRLINGGLLFVGGATKSQNLEREAARSWRLSDTEGRDGMRWDELKYGKNNTELAKGMGRRAEGEAELSR
jgi:hypothetical protein